MSNDTQTADRPAVLDIQAEPAEPQQLAAPRRAQVVQSIDDRPSGRSQAPERTIVRYSEEHLPELFAAMAAAQGAFKDLERTREARITGKANYEYDYETLADVIEATKDALAANGLAVWQFPFPGSSTVTIRTMVTHASGGWIYNDLTAAIDGLEPRAVGSGITYLCRYARKAILGIAAAYDDDAETASKRRVEAAGGPPKPAQRVSQQAAAKPMEPRGLIAEHGENGGAWFVRLDTGFTAATRDPEIGNSIKALADAKPPRRIELVTRAPRTSGYAPTITEIQVLTEKA